MISLLNFKEPVIFVLSPIFIKFVSFLIVNGSSPLSLVTELILGIILGSLASINFDLGGLADNETGVLIIDLKVIVLKFGLSMSFNFTSVIGIAVAYYILRYLR